MRRLLLLLSFIALLAVCVVAFLSVQRNNQLPAIVTSHNFQRVIPNDNSYSSTVPNQDIAQLPSAPPPAVPPVTQPTYTEPKTETDTIDASAPPVSSPTPVDKTPATSSTASTKSPSATSTATPSKSDTASKPETPAKPKSSFDEQGVFTLTKAMSKNGFHKGEPVVVVVDKGSHFTYVLQKQGSKVVIVNRLSNAIGTADTPSPPGPYKISDIDKYPVWVPTKSIDPEQKPVQPYNKDRKNPLGVARIRLNKFDVALHGTNNPGSIRKNASHGCIRHSNADIMRLVSEVSKGTTVIITEKFVGTKITKDMF